MQFGMLAQALFEGAGDGSGPFLRAVAGGGGGGRKLAGALGKPNGQESARSRMNQTGAEVASLMKRSRRSPLQWDTPVNQPSFFLDPGQTCKIILWTGKNLHHLTNPGF